MATKKPHVLEYRIVGKDEASAVFKRVKDNAQKMRREMPKGDLADRFRFGGRALGMSGMGDVGGGFAKGGYAAAAAGVIGAEIVGRSLERGAKAANEMADQFMRSEVSAGKLVAQMGRGLPVIGGFVGTAMELKEAYDKIYNIAKITAEVRKQEADAIRRMTERSKKQVDLRRQHAQASADGRRDAIGRIAVAGAEGDDRARIQNWITLDNELRKIERETQKAIEEDAKNHGLLKSQIERDAQVRRQAARAEWLARDKEITDAAYKRDADAAAEHQQRIADIETRGQIARLESQGRMFDARRVDIEAAHKAELRAIERRRQQEVEGLRADDPLRVSAQQRATEAAAKAEQEKNRRLLYLQQEASNARLAAERAHAERVAGMRANLAAQSLRAAGKGMEAEQLELESRLMQSLRDIQQRAEAEIRVHGEDREGILRRASEEAQLRIQQHAMDLDARNRERAGRYQPGQVGGIGGDTRLLTGQAGLLGPLAEPTKQTARNTKDAVAVMTRMEQQLRELIAATGASGTLPPPSGMH